MKNLKKILYLSLFSLLVQAGFAADANAQNRQRVIKTISSQPTNQPTAARPKTTDTTRSLASSIPSSKPPAQRPTLTSEITLPEPEIKAPLVKKTALSAALNSAGMLAAGRTLYGSIVSKAIFAGISSRYGIPYRYGSSGPNRYDCSGFVWAVFNEAGIPFQRESARGLWAMSEPVTGDERFRFGTLVFMNGLGHMGIVADENGFFHASSSKGITYSTFKGYWENRITGFRRLNLAPSEKPVEPIMTAEAK